MTLAFNNYSRTQQHPFFNQQLQQQYLDIDNIDSIDSDSIASSPHSTQSSLLSQYSNAFQSTEFDSVPSAVSRSNFGLPSSLEVQNNNTQSLSQVPDLMPSDAWMLSQNVPRVAQRFGHQRDLSTSSLGSNGPASPYTVNTSNPHIAITDSNSDACQDLGGGEGNYSYQLCNKPLTTMHNDNFYASIQNMSDHRHRVGTDVSFMDGLPNMQAQPQQHRPRDRGLLPAPELSSGSATRSHPASVASSTVGGDSPATPSSHEPEDDGRRRKNAFNNVPPKLDRTMTDIYSDELYSPNFTITSASPPPQTHMVMSPSNELFAQTLQAANRHLSAGQSSVSSSPRNYSPFRNGSPLAPTSNDLSRPQVRLNSVQQLREKHKAEHDSKALQQLAHNAIQQQGTPSTISPKDAMLEFNESDDASNFPLFPQESGNFNLDLNKGVSQQTQPFQTPTPVQSNFNFNIPTNMALPQLPQQYPFVARPNQQQQATPTASTFSRVGSADTTASDGSEAIQRPARTNADGGTYTCTYHGCKLRFDTPALLQKHKREGHRQANALSSVRATTSAAAAGVAANPLNSQAGPHRCDRINPSTGKSCNTVFSRPYDLTRHEDTIHNARKQKVRCNLCTEEKTFSRADALTRHYRVCHPDVEFPGKHRRRGGNI